MVVVVVDGLKLMSVDDGIYGL